MKNNHVTGWGSFLSGDHKNDQDKNEYDTPLYNVGDIVEIFYIYEEELFEIEDVIFEKGVEPIYRCRLISNNAGDDLLKDEGDYCEIEENEILKKIE